MKHVNIQNATIYSSFFCFYLVVSWGLACVVLWDRWPRLNPSPLSHLALPVVCCQPQQKSGRKQPEISTSLALQGMLCFFEGGTRKTGFSRADDQGQTQKVYKVSKAIQKKTKHGDLFSSEGIFFAVAMIWRVSPVSVWRCCLPWWDTCFLVLDSRHRLYTTLYAPLNGCIEPISV